MTCPVTKRLDELSRVMKKLELWADMPPLAQAFESDAPFCIDTMSLEQWLQFVFLPGMYALIDAGEMLPSNVAISPLAEEVYGSELAHFQPLIQMLKTVEKVLAEQQ